MKTEVIIVIALYVLVIYVIGFFASRVTKNVSDYIVGNRRLNMFATALGAGASDMSAWLMMSLPGLAYLNGITEIWLPLGLSIGAYLNWKYVAKRLRDYTVKYGNALTIPSYIANRFDDRSGFLRAVTAIAIILFSTIYIASALAACAFVMEVIFNMNYITALLISTIIIALYTSWGGFIAVNWIDIFQGTLMLFALLVVPAAIVMHLGGVSDTFLALNSVGANISDPFRNIDNIKIVSLLTWGLGYFGQPHILVRFMGAKSSAIMNQSRRVCMSWMVISMIGACLVGLFGAAIFNKETLPNHELVFLKSSELLFAPWLAGILFSAVLSAIMSTISAQLLVSSSSLIEDIFLQFKKVKLTAVQELLANKASVFLIICISAALAYDPQNTIFNIVSFGWAGLGASIGPVIILSLYWKKITREGAILGIILGSATIIVWKNLHGGIFELYELAPGFIMTTIGVVVGSIYFTKSKIK